MTVRTSHIDRQTNETTIHLSLNLDEGGVVDISTGIAFFDHMLSQVARHGRLGLTLHAKGDLQVDAHHTVEDCGIALGQALAAALGDKKGVNRFAHAFAPLDESLARVVVDLSGRPSLNFYADFSRHQIGEMDSDLFREFFQAVVNNAKITLHIDLIRGTNAHHQIEAIFKAFGLALRGAVAVNDESGIPSTKGVL